jgi:hypothetical protein
MGATALLLDLIRGDAEGCLADYLPLRGRGGHRFAKS